MARLRVPPGRAGRLWLRERLDLAESAVSLLEQKRALLEQEHQRLCARRVATGREWASACELARMWQQRAVLIGGQPALALAAPAQRADIAIGMSALAGVRYPDSAECTVPHDITNTITTSSAVVPARDAHTAALGAAADHAIALAAVRAVERELTATRVRARALRQRRIPDLLAALGELELALEERERAEQIPFRRSASGSAAGVVHPA